MLKVLREGDDMMRKNVLDLVVGDHVEFVDRHSDKSNAVPLPHLWFLLRVHPNRERKVERDLIKRGLSFYLPSYPRTVPISRRGHSMRTRIVDAPLFQGLIFIPDFDASLNKFRGIDGVAGFLHFGEQVAFARHAIIEQIRNLVKILRAPRSKRERKYQIGELVRIVDGPFVGYEGRIERLDDRGRIKILLDALQRGVSIQIDETQIEPGTHSTNAETAR